MSPATHEAGADLGAGPGSPVARTGDGTPAPDGRRSVTSFVHHRARLTEGQQAAWDRSWAARGRDVAEVLSGAHPYDPPGWFGRRAGVVLEIGSGMGEASAAVAAAEPQLDHLAVEVFEPGLAQLLMRIESAGLDNLALLRGDAVALLREAVPSASLAQVRIWFPDPWPKRRHRKRRLVQPDLMAIIADRLVPGGTVHLATDWADYATQMATVGAAEPLLVGGPVARPEHRPLTKFEQRAEVEGRDVTDLLFRRLWSPGDHHP